MPRWVAPLVLALLCLRAFVPAGYMLAPVDGRLAVVVCDADAASLGSHNHQGHGHDGAGHHHTQTDPTCPYAQSAGPAPLPALPTVAPALLTIVSALPTPAAQVHAH